jgi:nucleotide-binding universal stress UspA family protein
MTQGSLHIVVAYDGSDEAQLALAWSAETARLDGSTLRVVVVGPDPKHGSGRGRDGDEHPAQTWVESATLLLDQAAVPGSVVDLLRGSTVQQLLTAAEGARLCAVGSRGHSKVGGIWMGSVSQHLARHATCPVAVVRAAKDPHARQILVGVDGSGHSNAALRFACERATLTGESVLAVYGYQHRSRQDGGLGGTPTDRDTAAVEDADRMLAESVSGLTEDYPDVALRTVARVGGAGTALEELSTEASLVVVGSRGRGAFEGMLLGSVSQEALHRAACPVVVVH